MPVQIKAPDGAIVQFPDGTDDATITRVMGENYPAAAAAPQPEGMGLKDMATQAGKNLPTSALEFGKSMVYPFLHPIDTAQAMKDVGQIGRAHV